MVPQPHYLLICDSIISSPATANDDRVASIGLGRWHFVLERMDGPERLEAADSESYIHQDRLALLAVVRGLEALEHVSMVRLVTTSRYVDRGLRFGLPNWRETNYQWESFGERKPVRNADLWRRIDVAMQYHKVTCRLLKSNVASGDADASSPQEFFDLPTTNTTTPSPTLTPAQSVAAEPAMTTAVSNTELIGRFAPAKVAYRRVDSPHRAIAGPRRSRIDKPQQNTFEPTARLQWWEMAAKWDKPTAVASTTHEAAYGS